MVWPQLLLSMTVVFIIVCMISFSCSTCSFTLCMALISLLLMECVTANHVLGFNYNALFTMQLFTLMCYFSG